MVRLFLTFCLINIVIVSSFCQAEELIGAGVLDFLISNPKTVNNLSTGEIVGARIIRDLLNTQSERKYQLKYANAGSDKITINTTDGRQAQIVNDADGSIYILVDGTIYPIAQEFINQANNIDKVNIQSSDNITTIEPLNIEKLRERYNQESINDFHIRDIFAFKWSKDFNGDGSLSFEEFKYIKNTFDYSENFYLAVDYEIIRNSNVELVLEINDDYSGNLIFTKIKEIENNNNNLNLIVFYISGGELPNGTYLIDAKLRNETTKNVYSTYMETIQITQKDSIVKETTPNGNIIAEEKNRPKPNLIKRKEVSEIDKVYPKEFEWFPLVTSPYFKNYKTYGINVIWFYSRFYDVYGVNMGCIVNQIDHIGVGFNFGGVALINKGDLFGINLGLIILSEGTLTGFSGGSFPFFGTLAINTINAKGFTLAAANVVKNKMNGVMIGGVNYAKELHGVQFGIFNIAMNNKVFKYTPIFNYHFDK
ncbi:MAG: hypothetical protein HN704_10685 [Bacteroidetes bacterium]|nr:hypothetical protein [Bacteroidota bacterium]